MRFLLQRPTFDANDVPMIFEMLFNGTEDWKKQRNWMVRFLGDSMKGSRDWQVLKRRHTWSLLATLFQESEQDAPLRLSILQVNCYSVGSVDLVLNALYRFCSS